MLSVTQHLKGGAHEETLRPWNEVARMGRPVVKYSEVKTVGLGR
jgi:hypothetical protein